MSKKTIVVVSGEDNGTHAEINILEGPDAAARFIEDLLESGVNTDRVRVFFGEEMEMQVKHRPVVSLSAGETQKEPSAENQWDEDSEEESEDAEGEPTIVDIRDRRAENVLPAVAVANGGRADRSPYMRDGVRFSSLFRPA